MNPETNKNPPVNYKNKTYFLILVLIIISLSGLSLFQRVTYKKMLDASESRYSQGLQSTNGSNDCSQCNPTPTSTTRWPEGETKTYSSDKLGVSFNYYQPTNVLASQKFKITEENNRIYINNVISQDITRGVFVEVFQKDADQNLSEVIKQKFVKKDSSDKCVVEKTKEYGNVVSQTYEYLYIHPPYNEKMEITDNSIVCSDTTYMQGYFIMDKGHPNKYAFLRLGQASFGFLPVYGGGSMPAEYSISFY